MARLYFACLLGLWTTTAVHGLTGCTHVGLHYISLDAVQILPPALGSNGNHIRLFADFNGDGRTDYFKDEDGSVADSYYLASVSGVYYSSRDPRTEGWCVQSEGEMMAGDVNGDGRADLICRFNDGKKFQVRYYGFNQFSSTRSLLVSMECPMTSSLHIGDVSGDRADDFVCFDRASGKIWIHYNTPSHRHKRHVRDHRLYEHGEHHGYYEMPGTFCRGAGKHFRLGDFDGDKRKDLMCYDPFTGTNGQIDLAYAQDHGTFGKTETISLTSDLCTGTLDGIFVDDVNGDGMADVNCIDSTDSEKINFFGRDGSFSTTATADPRSGCAFPILYTGDINGDGLGDLICLPTNLELTADLATCQ